MSPSLPSLAPAVTPDTAEFWSATAQHVLRLPSCPRCESSVWYPRPFCPDCGSTELEARECCGRGLIYSCAVQRRGAGDFADAGPYVIANVQLNEGPRTLANIVSDDIEGVRIGQPVQAVFDDTDNGVALVRFTPQRLVRFTPQRRE